MWDNRCPHTHPRLTRCFFSPCLHLDNWIQECPQLLGPATHLHVSCYTSACVLPPRPPSQGLSLTHTLLPTERSPLSPLFSPPLGLLIVIFGTGLLNISSCTHFMRMRGINGGQQESCDSRPAVGQVEASTVQGTKDGWRVAIHLVSHEFLKF